MDTLTKEQVKQEIETNETLRGVVDNVVHQVIGDTRAMERLLRSGLKEIAEHLPETGPLSPLEKAMALWGAEAAITMLKIGEERGRHLDNLGKASPTLKADIEARVGVRRNLSTD